MITFAQLKHLKSAKFKTLHKEIAEHHEKVGYFFDWARQWEYPWILKNVPFKKKDIILDVGGGTCHFPAIIAKRVKRVDVGELYKERVWKDDTKNVFFQHADISNFKVKEKYDIVMCISVLEHIADEKRLKAIHNLTDTVKSGGYLVMTLDLFTDNTRSCRENEIPTILELLSKDFELGKVDLKKDDLYEKIKLQEMKLDLPNLYSRNYPNRTILGIIIKKK